MSGRIPNPGERGVFDLIDSRNVLNRTIRAQVADVNYEDGYLIVNYDGQPSGGKYVTVPPLWMSFPESGGAAWGRFMPQRSDMLKVSFDYDDSPHVVGYDIVAPKHGTADGRSGWGRLNELHKQAKANPSTKIEVNVGGVVRKVSIAKFAQLVPLRPGEYDFMSSGGAYIYGTNTGKLYMAGGAVSISLVKNNMLLSSTAQLMTYSSDDCVTKFGQVRRTNPINGLDEKVSIDANGQFKEFYVNLKNTIAAGQSTNLATFHIGNVVVDSGTTTEMLDGRDVRYLLRLYNNGILGYESIIDVNGNSGVSSSLGTSYKVNYPVGKMVLDFGDSVEINSPAIKLQGINGAPSASHPLFLTNIYKTAESSVISDLANHIDFLHTAINTIINMLQSGGAASTPPIAGAIAMGKIFQAGAALLSPMMSMYSNLPTSAKNSAAKFTNGYDSYLSKISKTG